MPDFHPIGTSRPGLLRMRILLPSLLVFAVIGGCGSRGSLSASNSRILTQEEMAQVSVSTVYELVERLRPNWLNAGSPRSVNMRTEIVVIQDGVYFGNVESLRLIAAGGLTEIRYLTSSQAANIPGLPRNRAVEAAIVLYRRPRD